MRRDKMGCSQPVAAALACSILFLTCRLTHAEEIVPLWPAEVPGEASLSEDFTSRVKQAESRNSSERVFGVTQPALTIRLANPSVATGAAVLVCPGGGYNVLAWQKEGLEVADWLNGIGVHAFVLKYRVPRREPDFKTMFLLRSNPRASSETPADPAANGTHGS